METEEDRNYVCTLDEASLKKAKEELNEDPKERLGAVQTLRKWIMEQPHLSCPTDPVFLLCYLRARYFSQLETRALLEGNFKHRTKFPQWFANMDTRDPQFLGLVDEGLSLRLPGRDKEGRQVVLIREGLKDFMNKYSSTAYLRNTAIGIDVSLLEEETHVNGTVLLIDFTGFTMKNQAFLSMDERKNFFGHLMGNTPSRIKAFHLYNLGGFSELVLGLVKLLMSEKMQKRITLHGNSLESVYKHIPMEMFPDEYLPDDYTGPSGGPLKDIIASTKAHFTSDAIYEKIKFISNERFKYDKSKKPSDVPQESFRKLNID